MNRALCVRQYQRCTTTGAGRCKTCAATAMLGATAIATRSPRYLLPSVHAATQRLSSFVRYHQQMPRLIEGRRQRSPDQSAQLLQSFRARASSCSITLRRRQLGYGARIASIWNCTRRIAPSTALGPCRDAANDTRKLTWFVASNQMTKSSSSITPYSMMAARFRERSAAARPVSAHPGQRQPGCRLSGAVERQRRWTSRYSVQSGFRIRRPRCRRRPHAGVAARAATTSGDVEDRQALCCRLPDWLCHQPVNEARAERFRVPATLAIC